MWVCIGRVVVALTAEFNGRPPEPGNGNRLVLTDLQAENLLTVRARCAYSRTGEGLHRFVDPADGEVYVYAQSFLDDAQRIFACLDQPDLKASFTLAVEAPPRWTVVGNARSARVGNRWEFAPTERMSTYLFTVAAGPWHTVTGTHEGIDLGLHCRRSLAEHLDVDADELLEVTAQCLTFQQDRFGRRYPFGDTYDQLFVPEFNVNAMENPGAVTFSETFIFRSRTTDDRRRHRAMVLAHEMAHMWFGDLVTMRWWDDLWLNESFAELMGYLTVDRATRHEHTWVDVSANRKAWGYRADQLPSTHPVQGDVPDTRSALLNFDGISYAKGASVLRQLMATVGEGVFFEGVRSYIERHAFANTTFPDLLHELERASRLDLHEWSRAWLQTSGVSTLRTVREEEAGHGGILVVQDSEVLRPHRIGVGAYDRVGDALVLRQHMHVQITGERVRIDVDPLPDLLLPNDGDLTFAKVRFDDHSLATVLADLRRFDDPLARAVCWAALWEACRDAELPAAAFVQAVLNGVDGEADPAVAATLLARARTAATLYARGNAPLVGALAEASLQAAWAAPVGSDLQLTRVRALAAVAQSSTHQAAVASLLDGTEAPAGLVVDTELRWHLVECLAAVGRLDDAAVDAELARDDSAAGRLHALTARAAIPTPHAKSLAWERVTGDTGLTNHETAAVAGGFWRSGQEDVLRPYVDRYTAELPALWDARTPQVAGVLAERLFPSTMIEQSVHDRTAVLERDDHPAGLCRYVAESRDDLRRALAARRLA